MKTNQLLSIVAVLAAGFLTPAFAQSSQTDAAIAQTRAIVQATKGTASITGSIVDSTQTTKAIEFASVALYAQGSTVPVAGTTADLDGKFTLADVAEGNYKLMISFVGFDNKVIDNLNVAIGQRLNVGVVRLASGTKTLAEVTVTGQANVIEEKVDRLVYNADKDIMAKGGDATDILRKVPLLSVDLDGNVSLRGNSNVRVLINNKASTIVASSVADALKQIPADQIKTVEVITSPSAKYDAEGSGGVINIITKKNSLTGLNLNVEGGVGNRGANLSLNGGYRQGKLGVTVGGFGRAMYNTPLQINLDQTSLANGVSTLTRQTSNGNTNGLNGQYNIGFDYDLAKNQSLTAGVKYGVRNQTVAQDMKTQLFIDGMAGTAFNRDMDVKNLSNTIDMNLDYLHTFKKPQQEWSISTLYSRNNLTNDFDANLFNGTGEMASRLQNLSRSTNQEFTLQSDYQTPIKQNQMLEFGAKGIIRQVDSDFSYLTAGASGPFVTDPHQPAGSLNYSQNIAAGYSSYTYSTKNKYTIKGGLRYEYTFIEASTQQNGNIDLKDYGTLVPSLNVSKTFNSTSVKLGYNRRIQRPGLQQLNPNFNTANPQNINVGNPSLRPELTNNIELGLSRAFGKTYVTASFFGRMTNNAITQLRLPSDTLAGAIVTTYQNIGRQNAYGTNLFANISVTPKINAGVFLNALHTSLTGQALNADGVSETLTNEGFNVSGGTFVTAQLGNGWAAQGFGFVQGTQVQLQGTQSGFSFYSLGVKKEFADKKASLGLAAENFLTSSLKINSVLNSAQFNQITNINVYNQGVRLTFSYKLGKTAKATARKTKSVSNDDVKSDSGSQTPTATPAAGAAQPR